MKTLFIRALRAEDKEAALREAVSAASRGDESDMIFPLDPSVFSQVPNSPFAYWVDDKIRGLFKKFPPFESEGRTVKQGLATADDFRFVRAWWEVPQEHRLDACNGPDWRADLSAFQDWCHRRTREGKYWAPFAKGGEYSPYYADVHLVVNWKDDGEEIKNNLNSEGGVRSNVWMLLDTEKACFFRPGVTWQRRANLRGSFSMLYSGLIFSDNAPLLSGLTDDITSMCVICNSDIYIGLLHLLMPRGTGEDARQTLKYEKGYICSVPVPLFSSENKRKLIELARREWKKVSLAYSEDELALNYGDRAGIKSRGVDAIEIRPREIAMAMYELDENSSFQLTSELYSPASPQYSGGPMDILMREVGLSFGRFDIRVARDPSLAPALADPFDPLPICPPAMLIGTDSLPAREDNIASEAWLRARPNAISLPPEPARSQKITAADYPIAIPWDGILVDDPDDECDIVKRLRALLHVLHGTEADAKERELLVELGATDLRQYLAKPGRFFAEHLSRYSKSRRKAPIYWPLQTSDGRFTLWIYYPRLSQDTLFACINIVDKKLSLERRKLELARNELNATEGRDERILVEDLEGFTAALSEMKEELERVSALPYKPDLDDGVMITASPLWKLFRHAHWQKELGSCWEKLEEGDFDWAHLSYSIWPERVEKKCRKDRSLAIAHGLETICEQKLPKAKGEGKKRGPKTKRMLESALDFEEDEE